MTFIQYWYLLVTLLILWPLGKVLVIFFENRLYAEPEAVSNPLSQALVAILPQLLLGLTKGLEHAEKDGKQGEGGSEESKKESDGGGDPSKETL